MHEKEVVLTFLWMHEEKKTSMIDYACYLN
jgi:hypothetical protein